MKLARFAAVVAAQAALVGVAVAPQLSARTTGDTYQLRVAPLDPIDPFRGAYVTLDYPDLRLESQVEGRPMFVTLVEEDGVMVADRYVPDRPSDGQPYLACSSNGFRVDCGIESFFLPQDEAAAMEDVLRDGAVAEVRIDRRGNAALIDVHAP